jgi:hypothetical protein
MLRPRIQGLPLAAAVLLAVGGLTSPSPAQCLVHQVEGTASYDFLGISVGGGGDVDGDGVGDFIAGALGYSQGGRAEAYSGATGLLLLTLPAPQIASCAIAGDVDGDGHADLIVGQLSGSVNTGTATVWSGQTGAILFIFAGSAAHDQLGYSVAGAGDVDGDGRADVIVGAPQIATFNPGPGYARVFSGATGALIHQFNGDFPGDALGAAVAGAGDVDGDGRSDLIVGAYRSDQVALDGGLARVYAGATGSVIHEFTGSAASALLGSAVAGAGDVNGDGRADLLVGAPGDGTAGSSAGAARVYSGLDGSGLHAFFGSFPGNRLGSAVAGAGDVDGDAVPDVALVNSGGASKVLVHSGASGLLIYALDGINVAAVDGVGDLDGDGRAEIVVGDPIANGPEKGEVSVWSSVPLAPQVYCAAKVNSQGCTPAIVFVGTPSASAPAPFLVGAVQVINQKSGILFYGTSGPASAPFQGGFLCVNPPITRTPVQSSQGNPPPGDCSGRFSLDFNALIQSGSDPALGPGTKVWLEYWYRDPAASFGSGLTDALEIAICS